MSYLIDTQILIWYQLNSKKLNSAIYELLKNSGSWGELCDRSKTRHITCE
ncbi:hypothetical protein CRENPOLYSF2_1180016 [Crenothrix polyspora]|uniref:PIN domain-containing protein n=1 Tax=Crenothrix polyspora TaxID=360316 RepID=A0A1R4GZV4_9GAMM|nr:hypothetical protein CRENPOLYSF2_1180016 [Crenothrix polyspora]